jgi:hypothetical protein
MFFTLVRIARRIDADAAFDGDPAARQECVLGPRPAAQITRSAAISAPVLSFASSAPSFA